MEAPNEQLVIRKRKLESWANEDPLFDEEMTVPINNGEPISNDDQSIYPIANAKSELSIKHHSILMLEMSARLIALTLFHRTSSFLLLFKKLMKL